MRKRLFFSFILAAFIATAPITAVAEHDEDAVASASVDINNKSGGGYAITGQLPTVGYSAKLYNAENGLPTSDANVVMADREGYIWIGGYAGIIRYDGTNFERLNSADGLTSGRAIFQDELGRIWIGTNDNGIVVIDGDKEEHITYKEGLTSSMIRSFAEADFGRIYIGTTNGICYMDSNMKVNEIKDDRLENAYIIRLTTDDNGMVYGNTRDGEIFRVKSGSVISFEDGEEYGFGKVEAIYPSQTGDGTVYIGNDKGQIFYGKYGDDASKYQVIDVSPAINVNWISEACGRIWLAAENIVGYLDENNKFVVLNNLPIDSGIEMITEDYQGNIWLASSRQGVAKVVTNNFQNVIEKARTEKDVVNSTCLFGGDLYIGTDSGLEVIDHNYNSKENELTEYLAGTRIRCIMRDAKANLWVSTYNNNKGLVKYSIQEGIKSFTTEEGMPTNSIRCTYLGEKGDIIVGTNGGVVILRNDEIYRIYGEKEGMENTVCLSVTEGAGGEILVGTDGGAIYLIDHNNAVRNIGRDEGLTSDVILRVKWDKERQVYWIITSNSIQYMKNRVVYEVKNFPYSNNFDIYFDNHDNAWVLSSYGVYCVNAQDMMDKLSYDYKLYNMDSGLSSVCTSNSFSELDGDGNLFICERAAVDKVNINEFFTQASEIRMCLKSITIGDEVLRPNEGGDYVIPASNGRVQINTVVLNYTLTNPLIKVFLEGDYDNGLTLHQTELKPLDYTGLKYGNYVLHIQILDESSQEIYQDTTYNIEKRPRVSELGVIRVIGIACVMLFGAFIVWRIMSGTIIRRQYKEIASAKDEAERANTAKTRFLANISNEIRTPINTIMGMDEMILREEISPTVKHYAQDIENATETLLGLIDDIIDISKIESGKMHLVEQEYNPDDLIRSIVKMIRIRSQSKGLKFEVTIDERLPRRLLGDSNKIKQVLLNFLSNALKYTNEGGFSLTCTIDEIDGSICRMTYQVIDTGIGLKDEDESTALGLDISKQFAELMDGTLSFESVYGEGTTYTFKLTQRIIDAVPVGEFAEEVEEKEKGPYVPSFVAPDAAVLVVDDNPMDLELLKGLLEPTRIFVSTAHSGGECLEKLKEGTFNVVLLDHHMSGMDGIETLEKLRVKYKDLPVYCMTSNVEALGVEFYTEKGFNGYLSKPIDTRILEKTIKQHIPPDIMMEFEEKA